MQYQDTLCWLSPVLISCGINKYSIDREGIEVYEDVDISDYIRYYQQNPILITDIYAHKRIPFKFSKIDGSFTCYKANITTLYNFPNKIKGHFLCSDNNLYTLEYGPKIVLGDYLCHNNNLKDVYGFPEFFDGNLHIKNNPVCRILDLVPKEKLISFIRILNEYQVIRNQDTIIESRLMDALSEVGVNELTTTSDTLRITVNPINSYKIPIPPELKSYYFKGYKLI